MSTTPRALATAAALLVGIAALGDLHARHTPVVAVELPAAAIVPLDDGPQQLVTLADPFADADPLGAALAGLDTAAVPGTHVTEVTTTTDGGRTCTTRVESVAGQPKSLVRQVSGDGCATATVAPPPRPATPSVPADTI